MNKNILSDIKCKKYYNFDMKKYNSYRLKFNTKCLIYPDNIQQLKDIIIRCRENSIKYKVVGECSNLIFVSDYDGVLIRLDNINDVKIDGEKVYVEAGYNLKKLALKTIHAGLTGLEFACGIPGHIGSALYNNSGAYKSDMGYIVEYVEVLTPTLEIKKMYNSELNYHYRDSFFKNNHGYICLNASLKLKKGNEEQSMALVEDRKKRRLESQPLEFPSAGSVFRNPSGLFAGELIEKLGYKGYSIGGAKVSLKHSNFIINEENASGEDILKLINEIKDNVKKEYNVNLILEQEIVNE